MSAVLPTLAEVSVLIAVPLTRTEFIQRVHSSDWLGKFRGTEESGKSAEEALEQRWREDFEPSVAGPLLELCNAVEALGADVRIQATLADLTSSSAHSRVVILCAHWKGAEIGCDDLVPGADVRRFLEAAERNPGPLSAWIQARLNDSRRKEGMDDVLNEALSCRLNDSNIATILEDPVTRDAARREWLDKVFQGLLRPGNRLELFDGLHDKWTVESALAMDFTGVLDLSACNSMVLGTFLEGRRMQKFRMVQFPFVVDFLWAAKVLKDTLSLVAKGLFEYQEARAAVTQILNSAVHEADQRIKWR